MWPRSELDPSENAPGMELPETEIDITRILLRRSGYPVFKRSFATMISDNTAFRAGSDGYRRPLPVSRDAYTF